MGNLKFGFSPNNLMKVSETPNYKDWSDDDLYLALCSGNEDARDHLWVRYTDKIYTFAEPRMNFDKGEARKISHKTLLALKDKCESFTPMNRFPGWVVMIAKTTISEHWRKEKQHYETRKGKKERLPRRKSSTKSGDNTGKFLKDQTDRFTGKPLKRGVFQSKSRQGFVGGDESLIASVPKKDDDGITAQLGFKELWERYESCKVDALTPMQKSCWEKRHHEGKSRKKIADLEGSNLESVKKYLVEAKKRLIECLGPESRSLFREIYDD